MQAVYLLSLYILFLGRLHVQTLLNYIVCFCATCILENSKFKDFLFILLHAELLYDTNGFWKLNNLDQ